MADPQILSLCSGIGGLDHGVRLVYPGTNVLGYVERDAYAASVLMARMEEQTLEPAPVWVDNLDPDELQGFRGRASWITAGYPCQPFSLAGKRQGERDPRHLWPLIREAVRLVRPHYVFLENVPGHIRLGLDRVLADLDQLGFDAEWTTLRASDVGAPHRRERLFVLAVGDTVRERLEERRPLTESRSFPATWPPGPDGDWSEWLEAGGPPPALPRVRRSTDGLPQGMDMGWRTERLRCLGNSVVPQQAAAALRILISSLETEREKE